MEKAAYRNVSYLFALILVFVVLGFFRTYFGLFPGFHGLPTIAHFHALGFLLWIAMLIVQPLLIRYDQRALHRALGKFSYFLVPYIVLTVYGMARQSYHIKGDAWLTAPVPPSLYFAILGISNFVAFYILAMVYKRNTAYHMRYIIVSSLALIQPAMGRFFVEELRLGPLGAVFATLIVYAILIGLIVYDKAKFGRVSPPYWVALAFTMLVDISVPIVPRSHIWQSIALQAGHYLR